MTWPQAVAFVGGGIAASLALIKIVGIIWGRTIRSDCMDKFKILADTTQKNMLNIASLQKDMELLTEKIDELKIDVRELSKFIRENFRANQRRD